MTIQEGAGVGICPIQQLLKMLAGKHKLDIVKLAAEGSLRFSHLMRRIPGANRQSVSVALREMEESGLLDRLVIREKPLHVEYRLAAKGRALVPLLEQLEAASRMQSELA